MDLIKRSYDIACAKAVQDELKDGGKIVYSQSGQIIIQFEDHYTVGNGLAWCSNPGQWKPEDWESFKIVRLRA